MGKWPERARTIAAVVLLLVIAQAVATAVYFSRRAARETEPQQPFAFETLSGEPAPVLELETERGARVDWRALAGKPVLVHFWASWCTPCRDELPMLLELARERAASMHILAISLDGDWGPIRLFFDGAIPEDVSRAVEHGAARRYGTTTLPDTFVVSASGALIARMRGPRNWRSNEARNALHGWQRR
jgi:thiol-disulfide isomerase/thioredoxin